MRIHRDTAIALLSFGLLAGCSASKPENDNVEATLKKEFGEVIEIGTIERIDGVAYPGGAGAPESYEMEFTATLIALGPVTVRLSRDLGKPTRVKTIVAGHEPDPEGMEVFRDAMTHRWRTDETRPAVVTGSIRFVKAESGWRASTMTVFLTDELMQAGSMPPRPRFERVAAGIGDNEQGLIWAQADNGTNVNWELAGRYCRALGSGWSLPTSAQLLRLYDVSGRYPQTIKWDDGETTIKLATPLIELSGVWYWSSESNGSSEAWTAHLYIDGDELNSRHSFDVSKGFGRALCVRRFSV